MQNRTRINPGDRFGRLVATGRYSIGPRLYITVKCDCGNEKSVLSFALKSGSTRSCGCLARENRATANITHGKSSTAIYCTWNSMITRCTHRSHSYYPQYGGRGIKVCERWKSFANFYADMGDRPKGMSLDRIDTDGDYCPENCRWATSRVQQGNRRDNRNLSLGGKTLNVAEWSRVTGIHENTIRTRLRAGWPVDRALSAGAC